MLGIKSKSRFSKISNFQTSNFFKLKKVQYFVNVTAIWLFLGIMNIAFFGASYGHRNLTSKNQVTRQPIKKKEMVLSKEHLLGEEENVFGTDRTHTCKCLFQETDFKLLMPNLK